MSNGRMHRARRPAVLTKKADKPESLDVLLDRVQRHVDAFEFEDARTACEAVLAVNPKDAAFQQLMGSICLELGDFAAAYQVRNGR